MINTFTGTRQNIRNSERNSKNQLTQAITHSLIKADDALHQEKYREASKFYKYALRLSEMQFGEQDLVVKNLRLLLKGIEEFLHQGQKKPQMIAGSSWRQLSD